VSRLRPAFHSRLSSPSSRIFIGRALALIAGVVTVLVTSRGLGPDGRGHVATFAVLMTISSTVLGFGAGVATYSLVARDEAEAIAVGRGLVLWSIGLLLAVAASAAAASTAGLLAVWLGSTSGVVIGLLAVGAAGQFLAMGLIQLATGDGRATTTALGFGLPSVLVMVATLFANVSGPSIEAFMAAQATGWIVAALVLALILAVPLVPSASAIRAIAARGRAAAIGDLANVLSYRLDILLLGLISGPAAVGVYSLAVQVLEPVWILATSASNGLLIRLRRLPAAEWAAATHRTIGPVTIVTAACAIATVALVPVAIAIVGAGFSGAQVAAAVLLPGIVMLAVSKILAAFQIASGRLGLSSGIATASVVCTTVADIALMPGLGATGAALASSIGYGVSMALWVSAFPRIRSARAGAG
jgi:O-antigen/teichoic acid export membrane protein